MLIKTTLKNSANLILKVYADVKVVFTIEQIYISFKLNMYLHN